MAKVSFTKLGLKVNKEVNEFEWNGQTVEVKQYLPIEDKFKLITNVLVNCQDTDFNNFMSISKMTMYLTIHIVINYTNVNITDKMSEDPAKLYDQLVSTGFMDLVKSSMDTQELTTLCNWCKETCEHVYTYRNSVYGILDAMSTDYNNLDLDINKLQEELQGTENLEVLRDTLTNLG